MREVEERFCPLKNILLVSVSQENNNTCTKLDWELRPCGTMFKSIYKL